MLWGIRDPSEALYVVDQSREDVELLTDSMTACFALCFRHEHCIHLTIVVFHEGPLNRAYYRMIGANARVFHQSSLLERFKDSMPMIFPFSAKPIVCISASTGVHPTTRVVTSNVYRFGPMRVDSVEHAPIRKKQASFRSTFVKLAYDCYVSRT